MASNTTTPNMQPGRGTLTAALVAIIAVAAVAGISLITANRATNPDATWSVPAANTPITPTIPIIPVNRTLLEVVATGTVYAEPTLAQIVLDIQTRSQNITQALEENTQTTRAAVSALEALGIAKQNLTTLSYTINPVYNYDTLEYYEVDDTFLVNMSASNTTLVGEAIQAAVQAGATQVEGVTFTLTPAQQAQLQAQALSLALQNAQQKAQQIAQQLGLKIVGIQTVNTQYTNYLPFSVELPATLQSSVQPPQLYPGQTQYTATIQVYYILS